MQHEHVATRNKATKQGQGTELQTPQAGSALDKHSAETTLHSDMYCVHLPSCHISAFQCRQGKRHMRNKAMILFSPWRRAEDQNKEQRKRL